MFPVENKKEIDRYIKEILKKFNDESRLKQIVVQLGYQGGSQDCKVSIVKHNSKYFYLGIDKKSYSSYWIPTGIVPKDKYESITKKKTRLNITVEINIAGRSAGLIARDNDGKIFLLHSGKIRGAKRRIGKTRFEENFRGKWINIVGKTRFEENFRGKWINIDGKDYALVAEISSKRFVKQLCHFIEEVDRIKNLFNTSDSNDVGNKAKEWGYNKEFIGPKVSKLGSKVRVSECDHGLIVDNLKNVLVDKGFKVANKKSMDLFIYKGDKIEAIFEVKTDCDTSSIYSAVGQLLINSLEFDNRPKLFMVLPNHSNINRLKNILQKIGIELVSYNKQLEFINLKSALNNL
jgi:hypothetical protein